MAAGITRTGIGVVGDISWGTHLCHFYETKQDLLDILLPYFRTGLENNEFCFWVVAPPLDLEEARDALRKAVPEADRHQAAGRIEMVPHSSFFSSDQPAGSAGSVEIISHTEWYLKGGAFLAAQVVRGWNEKLAKALAKGYAGMRANGNEAWLTKENWKDFIQYEKTLDEELADKRMIVLCSYPLSGASANEILDVVNSHQFALIRRTGKWEVVESSELKQAKAEINRLNEELEQRVVERTRELAAANEQLKKEIAERWRAEDRIRLIIDTIPVMAWSVRPDGIVDFLNQRWMNYAGLSLEQYVADPTGPIHPEDTPRVLEKWLAQMALGEGYDDEMRLRRADGEYRWFLVRTAPLRDESGKVIKWYGVSTDIEDRKGAEEALRASEAHLQAAVDAADIGLWDWDMASAQLMWLGHHEKLFGFAPGEFDGAYSSFEKHIQPEDLEKLNRAVQRARDEGSEYAHEYRVIWPDGSIHWIASRGRFMYDETGRPVRMCGAVLDITERKEAEEALRQSEWELAEAQRIARLGSWSFDIAANKVRWSEELFRIFDLEAEAFGATYEAFLSRVNVDDRAAVLWVNAEARSSGEPFEVEYRITTRNGKTKHVREIGYARKDGASAVAGLFGTAQDITEIKQAEDQLKRSNRDLRALSARLQSVREEESARIAREIHDELGSVLASLRWELEDIEEVISERPDALPMGFRCHKIAALIGLTDSVIDTVKRIASELRPIALDEFGLSEAIQWHAQQFQDRTGISVKWDSLLEDLNLNREQSTAIFRIFQEALTNTLRHAQATRVDILMSREGGEFVLTIRDNGKGITEDEKAAMSALGLLGMRERAHLIGGEIHVSGAEGRGTAVTLRAPLLAAPTSRKPASSE